MRIVKKDAGQPWPASTKEQLVADEGRMGDLPDRIEWGEQGSLAEVVKKLMPGHLHEGHRTILSRKCSEQQARAKELRHAEKVPAMTKEEIEKREVIFSKVMKDEWKHLSFMNNDWNPQLGWPEARNALQPGNYRAWRKKYGVCDAVVTSPWFAVLDIALPLAVLASKKVACIHVPSHYMTDMTESRAKYFRHLSHAGRLHVIDHLEHGPIGRRFMWALVFKNPLLRAKLLRGGELSGVAMFTFSMDRFAADGETPECAE
eukprot:gene22862-biopygen23645